MVAVALGAAILYWGVDIQYQPVVDAGLFQPTAVPAEGDDGVGDDDATDSGTAQSSDAVVVTEPTVDVSTVTARPNSQVAVLVANGTEVAGQAGRLTDRLRNQGFNTRQPKTATPQAVSFIYYNAGFAAEAEVVRSVLNTETTTLPLPAALSAGDEIDVTAIDVLVLIGADTLSTG